jgi:hypothetical protein
VNLGNPSAPRCGGEVQNRRSSIACAAPWATNGNIGWAASPSVRRERSPQERFHVLSNGRAVRDTKDKGAGPVLLFTAGEWEAFTAGVRAGEFD